LLKEEIATVISSNNTSPEKAHSLFAYSAPWWNHRCADAVEQRSTMCRIYKANASWDNWISYRKCNTQCQKTL